MTDPHTDDENTTSGRGASASSRARRLKSFTILAVIAWSALVFLAWSQTWFTLDSTGRAGEALSVAAPGNIAAPGLSALALAGLALAAALAIAGTIVRLVLGVLELVLGASITASALGALTDPVGAGQSAVTTATGIAGTDSIRAITTAGSPSFWPFLALVAGVLMAATGVILVVTFRRWPVSGRKYQTVRFAADDGRVAGNPIDLVVSQPVDRPDHDDVADVDAADIDETDDDASDDTVLDADPDAAAEARRTRAVDSWDSLSRGQDPTD